MSAVDAAKKALLEEVMRAPLAPTTAAVSAYANGMLQTARLSALMDFVLEVMASSSAPEDPTARLDELYVKQLQQVEQTLKDVREGQGRIQVASNVRTQ